MLNWFGVTNMKKTLIAGAVALSMGVASNASALVIDITAMNFGSTSSATGVVDTDNLGTTFSGSFFGAPWTATTVAAFTAAGAGNWSGTAPQFGTPANPDGSFSYDFTLSAGQVAFGTLFDWSVNIGIPVLAIFNADGSAGAAVPMQVGPFPTQAPSFQGVAQTSEVPVPAAVWLFGSGLVGLAGIARRRKAA